MVLLSICLISVLRTIESEMNGGMIWNGPGSGAPRFREPDTVKMKQKQ